MFDVNWDIPKQCTHSEYWQNDELFFVESIKAKSCRRAKSCISCQRCFPKRNPTSGEGDIIISHQERYMYPLKDGNGKIVNWEVSKSRKAAKYYCAKKSCLLERHPYIWKGLLVIAEDSKHLFDDNHYAYLFDELHYI